MTFKLTGKPSDELPEVLASGLTDVRNIFVSMSAREAQGRDAEYLEWHSLDHRPEQYRVAGIRHSLRLVSTPACRAARACSDKQYDAVDHVMTYFFTADAALDQFSALGAALSGERRPLQLPSVVAGTYTLAGKIAAARAVAGADVIPWRPAQGVYLLIERGTQSPAALVDVPGIAGIWWHAGGTPLVAGFADNSGIQISYCFIDDDPLVTAQRLSDILKQRWASGVNVPLLAAPFYTLVPFEWSRHLP